MALFVSPEHPIKNHYLMQIRDKTTPVSLFRQALHRLSLLVVYDSLRLVSHRLTTVETPVAEAKGAVIDCQVTGIAILRAGLSMIPALIHWIPDARVECLGMARNPNTLHPKLYYNNIYEKVKDHFVVILDPLIATGGSVCQTLSVLKECKHLVITCIIASPEGIKRVQEAYSFATIFTAAVDKGLNDKGYIVPGLGDAGERYLGIA